MIIGASPTLQPPQVSPDGKWIWDGHQWQPLPEQTWEPAAAAVMPPAVAVAVPIQRRAQPSPVEIQPSPVEIQPQPAAFSYPVAETPITPLWVAAPRSGLTIYMYAGAAAVVLIMVMMVLNSTSIIQLPWPGGASSSAGPTALRSAGPQISDFARADRFVSIMVTPSLLSVSHTLPGLQTACTGTLSNGCLTALNAARQQMTELLSNIDHGDVPPCIAAGTTALRFDLQSMAGGLDLSLNGYQDNNGAELYQGIYRFAYFGRSLKADPATINAQKAHCSKVTPS
jgi:hypothetical protein